MPIHEGTGHALGYEDQEIAETRMQEKILGMCRQSKFTLWKYDKTGQIVYNITIKCKKETGRIWKGDFYGF